MIGSALGPARYQSLLAQRSRFSSVPPDLRPGATSTNTGSPLAYAAANRRTPPPVSPLAPTSTADILARINKIASAYGTPLNEAQIGTTAQGMLDPVVAQITANINKQAGQATDSIAGHSQSLAHELGAIDYSTPYNTAEGEQAAVDAALREALGGGGAQLANDLQSRLGVIGDPSVAAAGQHVAATGAAAGATELARGSANLGSLIANAASASSYGQKLPGFARMQGLQDIAGVQQGAVNDIANQTGSVTAQLPGLVQALRSDNQTLRGNKAQLVASLYDNALGREVTKGTAAAGLGLDVTKLNYSADATAAKLKAAQDRQETSSAAALQRQHDRDAAAARRQAAHDARVARQSRQHDARANRAKNTPPWGK